MPIFRTNKRANQKQTVMKKVKEKKTVLFRFMITPSEKKWIEEKAEETGLTQSQVVRHYHLVNLIKEK
jgi:hypothetical protein